MKKIFFYLKKSLGFLGDRFPLYMTGIIGIVITYASASLFESYLVKKFLDQSQPQSMDYIIRLIGMLVLYIVLITVLMPLFTYMFNKNAKYSLGSIMKDLHDKILRLSVHEVEKNHSGEILSYFINDAWSVAGIVMRHFKRTMVAVLTIVIYLVPMFILDYRITLIVLLLNIITFSVNSLYFASKLNKKSHVIFKELSNLNVLITNVIGGMSIIRIYKLSKVMSSSFKKKNHEVTNLNLEKARIIGCMSGFNFMIGMVNIFVFIFLGSWMVGKGLTSYGNIIAIMSLQTVLNSNFNEFAVYFPQMCGGFASTERIYSFISAQSDEPDSYHSEEISNPEYIEFNNVSFRYNDEVILDHFNLKIKEHEVLGLIGESGCGKSTLMKLLLGFYPLEEGGISVGGIDVSQMSLMQLRSLIAYVPQEPMLFNMSIKENIRYGRLDATDEEVYEAAKAANADDFINNISNGYETMVGESGARLSGGQCQRIAIARALIKNAPILIMDEATSALDSESERFIKETMNAIAKDKTMIIIAHRSSTIEYASRIYDMSNV
jgi:ABC-type multidrug transport system fused ATPase/permease subunit